MDRSTARRVLGLGLVLGAMAEILFDGPAIGANVPISVAALLAAGWLVRRRGTAPDPWDAWLPIAAIACAAAVAVSGDRFLALLDTVAALGLTGASVVAMSGVAVTRRSAEVVAALGAWAMLSVWSAAPATIRDARPTQLLPRGAPGPLAPFGRGLLLGVPIALVFVTLFASADPIFGSRLDDLLGFSIDLGDVPGRTLFTLGCAWLAIGLLTVAARGIPALAAASLGAASTGRAVGHSTVIGKSEAVVILVLVDLVSGAFVAFQLAYLFGGLDTLAAAGMTYSDYARRGFFELVAAACLAGGLLVILEIATEGRTRTYLAAALALVGLTLIVLASAWLRLDLYQLAYGWTELRFYVAAAIVTLAVALLFGGALLVGDRMPWIGHGLAVLGVVALLTLNVLAPGAFVAERNLERAIDPSLVPADGWVGLDTGYLGALGDDAIPVIVDALPRLAESDRAATLYELERRRIELTTDPAWTSPAAWNMARERARAALSTLP
jgi:hypothetical protein